MAAGILGRKLGMTQVFDAGGKVVPVTVIEAGPCQVIRRKTTQSDGYEAIQIGFDEVDAKKINSPLRGVFARVGLKPRKHLREVRIDPRDALPVGSEITCSIFVVGDRVDVIGTSKGKGFAGVIKRHHFKRGPMSHGSMYHRRTGALGATDPARVFKGRKLPGRMGFERVTARNLEVVSVEPERNLLMVKGAVPGSAGRLVLVRGTKKAARRKKK